MSCINKVGKVQSMSFQPLNSVSNLDYAARENLAVKQPDVV